MEELGIGRPSTYASILQVLQDREYVVLDKRRFVPEDRGRLVTTFLSSFFNRYVAYNFTADMESQLDDVSAGQLEIGRAHVELQSLMRISYVVLCLTKKTIYI